MRSLFKALLWFYTPEELIVFLEDTINGVGFHQAIKKAHRELVSTTTKEITFPKQLWNSIHPKCIEIKLFCDRKSIQIKFL